MEDFFNRDELSFNVTVSPPLFRPIVPLDAVWIRLPPNGPVGVPPPNTTAAQSAGSVVPGPNV